MMIRFNLVVNNLTSSIVLLCNLYYVLFYLQVFFIASDLYTSLLFKNPYKIVSVAFIIGYVCQPLIFYVILINYTG